MKSVDYYKKSALFIFWHHNNMWCYVLGFNRCEFCYAQQLLTPPKIL
jgi:hypothetical protein